MGNASNKTRPIIDEPVAQMVAKATTLSRRLGAKGYEYITPPLNLSARAKPITKPKTNPIEAAELQLKVLSSGYKIWLREDMTKLRIASKAYEKASNDTRAFENLNACVHTIKGNAPILGCESAGMIACPLTDLMEGCSEHKKARPILSLAVNAICQAIEHNTPANDPALGETVAMLNQLNSRCSAAKSKAQEEAQKTNQAAGKANCSSCASDVPQRDVPCPQACPGTCPASSSSNICSGSTS